MAGYFKALKSAVTGSEGAPYEVSAKHQHFEERAYPAMKWVCTKRKGRSRAEVQKDMFMTLFAYINGKNEGNTKIDMTVPVTVSYVQCEEEPKPQNGETEDEKKPAENGTDEHEEKPKENGEEEKEEGTGDAAATEGEKKTEEAATNGEGKEKEKDDEKKKTEKKKKAEETGPLKEYTMGFYIPKALQENPPKPSDPEVFIEERPAMTVVTRTFGGYAKDARWENEKESLMKQISDTPGTLEVDAANFFTAGYDPPFKPLFRRNEVWLIKTGGEVEVPPPAENDAKKSEKTENKTEKDSEKNGDAKPAENENKENGEHKEEEEKKPEVVEVKN